MQKWNGWLSSSEIAASSGAAAARWTGQRRQNFWLYAKFCFICYRHQITASTASSGRRQRQQQLAQPATITANIHNCLPIVIFRTKCSASIEIPYVWMRAHTHHTNAHTPHKRTHTHTPKHVHNAQQAHLKQSTFVHIARWKTESKRGREGARASVMHKWRKNVQNILKKAVNNKQKLQKE